MAGAGSRLAPLAVAWSRGVVRAGRAQEDTRRLWDSEFLSKRARPRRSRAPEGPRLPRGTPPTCRRAAAAPAGTPLPAAPGELSASPSGGCGRRRRPTAAMSRLLVQETENQRTETVEWTPERVEAETPFAAGDRVRLSIESPRAGIST